MKIYKSNMMAGVILFFLLSRILIDSAWSDAKPIAVIVLYTLACIILSTYLLLKGKTDKKTIPLLLFIFPSSLLISQLYSSVEIVDHIKFATQVFVPCLFLVAATSTPKIMHRVAEKYKTYFSAAAIFILITASYANYIQNALPGNNYYQHYQNAPDHVIAQALLKSSLPLITSGFIWVAIAFILISILNVRSVMLAYYLNLTLVHRKIILQKRAARKLFFFGIPLLIFVAFQIDWLEIYNRVVFKGRDVANVDNLVDSAASGRLGIYEFYLSYILQNFGLKEWLFGTGPIWLSPNGPALSAHNDILNLFVSFGIIGFISTFYCYFYFYKKIPDKASLVFATAFMVLLATNGVVFHQSNVLFVLLYIFLTPNESVQNSATPRPTN